MKAFVSYVIQDKQHHRHCSEEIEIRQPSYTFSPDLPISLVMDWIKEKKNKLSKEEELIVINVFKL